MSDVRETSRRLRDLCEPIAGSVYFAPEAITAYEEIGLNYISGYFTSRSACLGRPPAELVVATFGVFAPHVVHEAIRRGWAATTPEAVLEARGRGATACLRRILGEPDTARPVEILREVMESVTPVGRPIFAGLRSLPFPDDPVGALWRVCDYVRERRGDAHVTAWTAAGVDPVEITLLTELFWGLEPGAYVGTRGWRTEEVEAANRRVEERGWIRDGAFTPEGRALRRAIEDATDRMDADVVEALGGRAEELFGLLEPWTDAVLEAGAYPADPRKVWRHDDRVEAP